MNPTVAIDGGNPHNCHRSAATSKQHCSWLDTTKAVGLGGRSPTESSNVEVRREVSVGHGWHLPCRSRLHDAGWSIRSKPERIRPSAADEGRREPIPSSRHALMESEAQPLVRSKRRRPSP